MMTTQGSPTRTSGPVLAGGAVKGPPAHVSGREPSCLPPVRTEPAANGLEELVEGFSEFLDALIHQRVGDGLHRNAGLLELLHGGFRTSNVLGEAGAYLSVVAEGIQRRRGNGVDGVPAHQFLNVEDVR